VFRRIVDEFNKLLPVFKMFDIQLAGGDGTGEPEISYDAVIFNGNANCGHKKAEIIIPWPDDKIIPLVAPDPEKAISGMWFGGHLLRQRVCNGDCSYETFYFPRIDDFHIIGKIAYYNPNGTPVYYEERLVGKAFNFCKTAFRPYDIAVTAFLVIAKHHLGDEIVVRTDGEHQHWEDAFTICQNVFGYGSEYTISKGELVRLDKDIVIF